MNDLKSLLYSNMRSTKDTVFIIHGWLGYYEDLFNVNVTSGKYNKRGQVHITIFDLDKWEHIFFTCNHDS